jgi:hypothetical protein
MITAIVALLSILVGLAIVAVAQLAVIASHLADLKAYTMTHTSQLAELVVKTQPTIWPKGWPTW